MVFLVAGSHKRYRGFVDEAVLAAAFSEETSVPMVDVDQIVPSDGCLALLPYEVAKQNRALPISLDGDVLTVAFADPFDDMATDMVERATGCRVEAATGAEVDIAAAIERHYGQGISIDDTVEQLMANRSGQAVEDIDDEPAMVRLANQIIADAINQGATDVHIEPDARVVRVRIRLDGVLMPHTLLPGELKRPLLARIKVMADLNVTERRLPQDGRILMLFGRRHVDLRVSTLPTSHGESAVMRILESSYHRPRFMDLGLNEPDAAHLEDILERPFGMVLVTGPTGSGKTTTLYAALERVDSISRSVFTLEDPVEYALPLIRQTPVRSEIGMTFAAGLRALLRQDPDIIVVGEVRDTETAELASRAALTGHLVLSTLHTNNAAGVIPRLVDMGVERYLIPAALSLVMGQRLIRKLCTRCRAQDAEAEDLAEQVTKAGLHVDPAKLWRAVGCGDCRGTGFRGRTGVYEVMALDETFHPLIIGGASASDLESHAIERGMTTMLTDGLRKAELGETSVDEVLRVVR